MEAIKRIPIWIYTLAFCLFYLTGETSGAARFLSHVPQADYTSEILDRDIPEYDADVKLPGRHYPKLPYQNPYLENEQDDFREQHHQRYQGNHNNGHHKTYHHQQTYKDSYSDQSFSAPQTPVLAYGVRRDPYGSTFVRERHNHNSYGGLNDYVDDTGSETATGREGSMVRHRLDVPDKIGPSTTTPPPSPSFERNTPRSITVQAGKTAALVCRVMNVGNESVSWMRHEDLHILTVGKYKYSTDSRLSVTYNEDKEEWVLKIQSVNQNDAGLYECQVSTKPVLSFIVSMNVIDPDPSTTPFPHLRDAGEPVEKAKGELQSDSSSVPSARILNGPDIFVHRGSLINLTCIVDHTVEKPLYIYWYHYNKVIDYENEGDTVVLTKSGPNTISNLLVKDASKKDSGKYTCRPSNGEDASVMLNVLNGEHQAAMQTNTSDRLMTSLATILGAISIGVSAVIVMCRC